MNLLSNEIIFLKNNNNKTFLRDFFEQCFDFAEIYVLKSGSY